MPCISSFFSHGSYTWSEWLYLISNTMDLVQVELQKLSLCPGLCFCLQGNQQEPPAAPQCVSGFPCLQLLPQWCQHLGEYHELVIGWGPEDPSWHLPGTNQGCDCHCRSHTSILCPDWETAGALHIPQVWACWGHGSAGTEVFLLDEILWPLKWKRRKCVCISP